MALEQVAFRDRELAAQNLATIAQRVPPSITAALPPLLAECPDPDSALNLFERLASSAGPELFRSLDRHKHLIHYALIVFAYSQFLGETLIQNTDLFQSLLREKNLDRTYSSEEFRESMARFRSRSFETDTALLLARFKRREYVHIMLRDVLGIATLAETTAEISALADVLIQEALREADSALRNRHGPPQHVDAEGRLARTPFAVLSLGKLGGNELNYSSDVDLLFLYGDGQEPAGAALSNREYFIRLAQHVTEILSRMTREGAVFRIDLRLRPQGREGEPAIGLRHALQYYSELAQDWELQALIKVRHSAGDLALAREFIRAVHPRVYTEQINFAAIETALATRDRIHTQRRAAVASTATSRGIDVKLDRGGIRDIEFLVQCLQRVYGGGEPWLRSGGTLFSLQKLHDKGHITGRAFHDLTSSYEFLRRVEHRLQLRRGQQTHRLPQSEADLEILERSFGNAGEAERRQGMVETLRVRMAATAEIYARIIYQQQQHQAREQAEGDFHLESAGVEGGRELSNQAILQRLATESPKLWEVVRRPDLPLQARRNLFRFFSAALTSSERYATVLRSPEAVERAVRLLDASDFLTDTLIRHPEEIATIAEIGDVRPNHTAALFAEAGTSADPDPVFRYVASAATPHGEKMALLRQHYRHRVFAAGARDVMELRPVYCSLAETTLAADEAIAAALALADAPSGFAVLALGRLGSGEFDVLSDADLIFLRSDETEARLATRTAEKLMTALAAYTRDGTVFAVDPRLRPHGGEGELVITPCQLSAYFTHEAQPWEALTYTKLRLVAGCQTLAEDASAARQKLLTRYARDPAFVAAVREMREKLERTDEGTNFKSAPGGFYDIDFIASYLSIREGISTPGNIHERLETLSRTGHLPSADAAELQRAAELVRTVEHVVRLVIGRRRKTLPRAEHARHVTEELTAGILRRRFQSGLAPELDKTFAAVRGIYEKIVS